MSDLDDKPGLTIEEKLAKLYKKITDLEARLEGAMTLDWKGSLVRGDVA
jgi:hypothetical protein